ncbi:MAG: rhodanese-like domain-containing protein [Chitinophagaceae bacterium]|nr:rhodanese-like domain-containing protein [Chitinophagaceae bacterium]
MFSFLFGPGKNSIKSALRNGAIIIDVRTVHEYDQGRIKGSINIPTDRLAASVERIRQFKKLVVFCGRNSAESSAAVRFIKKNGMKEVYDGGNWERLLIIIKNL